MHQLVLLWYRCKTRTANRVQVTGCVLALFNPETSIFEFRNVIPALAIYTQKLVGTVKTRFYIVEMF